MSKETLLKLSLAAVLAQVAPSCAVERGVIIDRQGLPEENALYVNLIRKNKSKQKPLSVQSDGLYDADRKLFFPDSAYIEPFIFALPGDTISFRNPLHKKYLDMGYDKNRVRDIRGVGEKAMVDYIRQVLERQK